MEFLAIYRDFVTLDKLWLAIAIIAFLIKCFTHEFVSFTVGCAGILTFIAANTFFAGKLPAQIITFIVSIFVLNPFIQPYSIRKNEERRIRQAKEKNVPFFGKTGVVIERIDNMNSTGKISIDGTEQKARSATGIIHQEGENVRVVDHDRTILLVV
mgnify:CR=1 FL=1